MLAKSAPCGACARRSTAAFAAFAFELRLDPVPELGGSRFVPVEQEQEVVGLGFGKAPEPREAQEVIGTRFGERYGGDARARSAASG